MPEKDLLCGCGRDAFENYKNDRQIRFVSQAWRMGRVMRNDAFIVLIRYYELHYVKRHIMKAFHVSNRYGMLIMSRSYCMMWGMMRLLKDIQSSRGWANKASCKLPFWFLSHNRRNCSRMQAISINEARLFQTGKKSIFTGKSSESNASLFPFAMR